MPRQPSPFTNPNRLDPIEEAVIEEMNLTQEEISDDDFILFENRCKEMRDALAGTGSPAPPTLTSTLDTPDLPVAVVDSAADRGQSEKEVTSTASTIETQLVTAPLTNKRSRSEDNMSELHPLNPGLLVPSQSSMSGIIPKRTPSTPTLMNQ
jgi:hypothetical protein